MTATAPAKKKPKKEAKAKEPKAGKVKKPGPKMVRIAEYKVDHWNKIGQLTEEIEKDQARFDNLKKSAMEIKSSMNGKQVLLRKMIHDGPEHLPLFDGPNDSKPAPAPAAAPVNGTPVAAPAAPPVNSEAWRDVLLLDSLIKAGTLTKPADALLARVVAALVKSKVDTVGKLETLRATGKGGRKWWDAIKGLSEDAADKVTDSVTTWLQKNRDSKEFAAAAPKKPANTPEITKAKADETVPVHAKKKPAKKRKAK
jgi:hypothetical protein